MMQELIIKDDLSGDKYYTFFSQSHKLLCILALKDQDIKKRSSDVDSVWFEIVELKFKISTNEFFIEKKQIFLDLHCEQNFDLVDVYSNISLTDTGDLLFLPFQKKLAIWFNEK